MGVGTGLLSLGFTTFLIKKNEEIQEIELRTADVRDAEFDRLFQRSLKNSSQVKSLSTKVDALQKDYKTNIDKIYAEAAGAAKNATIAREKANNALYETRAGRTKLESQIAEAKKQSNNALYETRAGRTKLEDKIAQVQSQINKFTQGVTSNFQSKIEITIGIIQNRLSTTENKVANIEKAKPTLQDKVIKTVQDSVNKVSSDLGSAVVRLAQLEKVPAQVQALQSQVKTIEVEHPKRWGITVTQAEVRQATITKSTDSATRTYVERRLAQVTESQFSATEWVGRYGAKTADLVNNGVNRLEQTDTTLASAITTVATNTNQRITNLKDKKVIIFGSNVNALTRQIKDLEAELEQTKLNQKKVNADLNKIDTQLKEQEKVNQTAIPKLDQILGILPVIPARTADVIRPSIPTIPQIENAAKTGTCQTFQPGGCGAKALDDLGNGVNQNTNNQAGNLLDKLNAGANAAQLALLKIIDNKLGSQLPGGLSATFGRLWQMLQVDRILNILTYIAVIHNAMMLSNNILKTLFTIVDNISQSVGFKWTNEKGEDAGFGSLINEWTGNFIKSIFGEETFKNISKVWNAANRIYQAAANIAGLVQSIQQSILTALEVVGGSVARLANALRAAGQVFDRAYEWMNPNPNFDNALFRTLEKIQGVASNIETVSQTPLTIKSAVEGMKEEKKAMGEALKDGEAGLKGLGIIESENQVKKADKRKEESAGKNLENVDKVEGEKDEPTS